MHTTPSALRSTGWHGLAVTASVVLGVLAMHGLGTHGLSGPHDAAQTPTQATAITSHHATAAVSPLADGMADRVGDALAAPSGQGAADGLTQLCTAILGLGLALLLLLRARRAVVPWFRPTARWPAVRIPAGRDRDPPTLALLSIQRC
jgi:hypothetical protein